MSRPVRWLLSCFIIGHLTLITIASLPRNNHPSKIARLAMDAREKLYAFAWPVLQWSGLWQEWSMFAPNPPTSNFGIGAEITFQDGTRQYWNIPSMQEFGYLQRYQKERWRKWGEYVRLDSYSGIWPDTARWIARQFPSRSNPPVYVVLTRYWTPIAKPRAKDYFPLVPLNKYTNQYTYFRYLVKPQDLT